MTGAEPHLHELQRRDHELATAKQLVIEIRRAFADLISERDRLRHALDVACELMDVPERDQDGAWYQQRAKVFEILTAAKNDVAPTVPG